MAAPQSALLIEVPEAEPVVAEWRAKHDPAEARGIPAHITALFPFIAPGELTSAEVDQLRSVAGALRPVRFALVALDEFPGVLWLRPAPSDELSQLTRVLWAAYPQCPPYGGRFPDTKPHLTVALARDEEEQQQFREAITQEFAGSLPIYCEAKSLSLFTSDGHDRWARSEVLPFGG